MIQVSITQDCSNSRQHSIPSGSRSSSGLIIAPFHSMLIIGSSPEGPDLIVLAEPVSCESPPKESIPFRIDARDLDWRALGMDPRIRREPHSFLRCDCDHWHHRSLVRNH